MQREKVETLIADDKALEKGFKKEFAETEGHLQALFNLFKRRTVARNTSPAAQAQVPPRALPASHAGPISSADARSGIRLVRQAVRGGGGEEGASREGIGR